MSDLTRAIAPNDPLCECGTAPSTSESPGTGFYFEDGRLKFICYACWCRANYGADEPGVVHPAPLSTEVN